MGGKSFLIGADTDRFISARSSAHSCYASAFVSFRDVSDQRDELVGFNCDFDIEASSVRIHRVAKPLFAVHGMQ